MSDSDSFDYKVRDSRGSRSKKNRPRPKNKIQREREKEEELDDLEFGHPRRSFRKKKNKYFDHDGFPLQENDKKAQKNKKRRLMQNVFSENIKSLCEFILNALINHEFGPPFNFPVDVTQYTDYREKIKHPMDFSTIKKKNDMGNYYDSDEFVHDVRLVFKNCLAYNDAKANIVFMAETLSKYFEERWAEVKQRESKLLEIAEMEDMKNLINELRVEHQKLISELQRLVQSTSTSSPKSGSNTSSELAANTKSSGNASSQNEANGHGRKRKERESKPLSPFDYQKRQLLRERIERLSADDLQKMVELATSLLPNADQKNGELELDLESLPEDSLRKLSSFVNKCLKRANGSGHVNVDGSSSDSSDGEVSQQPTQVQTIQQTQPPVQEEPKIEPELPKLEEEIIKPSEAQASIPADPPAQQAELSTTPVSDSTIATTTNSSVSSASDQMIVEKTEQPQNVSPPPGSEQKAESLLENRPADSVDAMVTS